LHRRLAGTSVHLSAFPKDRGRRNERLETAMDAVRKFASLARAAREAASQRVRQPLARMKVAMPGVVDRKLFAGLQSVLQAEVNVKEIEVVGSDGDLVKLRGKANFRTLGKVYGKDTPRAAAAVADLSVECLRSLEAGESVEARAAGGETFRYRPEDVVVEREVLTDWLVQSDGPYVVALDPALTPQLKQEGIAREVVSRIQRLRKEAGYDYADRIATSMNGSAEVLAAVRAHSAFIIGETLTRKLVLAEDLPAAEVRETVDVDGLQVAISLARFPGKPEGVPVPRAFKAAAGKVKGRAKPAGKKKKAVAKKPARPKARKSIGTKPSRKGK